MNFSLPAEVTVKKQQLDGQWVYCFRHNSLGELGRVVVQGLPNGQCHIASEVAGDPKDPMTDTRRTLLQPISEQLTAALESVLGEGDQSLHQSAPASPKAPREVIETKLMPCNHCGATAALLIFAYDAKTAADFEDYARKMYTQYSDLNVPTWIIGAPSGIAGYDTPSNIMKVWPNRKPLTTMTPDEFNPQLDDVLTRHC